MFAEEGITLVVNILNNLWSSTAIFNPESIGDLVNAAIYIVLILCATSWHPCRLLLSDLNVMVRLHNEVFDPYTVVLRNPARGPSPWRRSEQGGKLLELLYLERICIGCDVAHLKLDWI